MQCTEDALFLGDLDWLTSCICPGASTKRKLLARQWRKEVLLVYFLFRLKTRKSLSLLAATDSVLGLTKIHVNIFAANNLKVYLKESMHTCIYVVSALNQKHNSGTKWVNLCRKSFRLPTNQKELSVCWSLFCFTHNWYCCFLPIFIYCQPFFRKPVFFGLQAQTKENVAELCNCLHSCNIYYWAWI